MCARDDDSDVCVLLLLLLLLLMAMCLRGCGGGRRRASASPPCVTAGISDGVATVQGAGRGRKEGAVVQAEGAIGGVTGTGDGGG